MRGWVGESGDVGEGVIFSPGQVGNDWGRAEHLMGNSTINCCSYFSLNIII